MATVDYWPSKKQSNTFSSRRSGGLRQNSRQSAVGR
jgi:hypothetical protein